jgi:DNA-binding NtrC family response regulator
MPVMEGVTFLRLSQNDYPGLPVILMTAGDSLTEHEAIKIGAAAFVKKPFSFDFLINLIQSVMA